MATADVAQDLVPRRHKSTTFFLLDVFEHPAHVVVHGRPRTSKTA